MAALPEESGPEVGRPHLSSSRWPPESCQRTRIISSRPSSWSSSSWVSLGTRCRHSRDALASHLHHPVYRLVSQLFEQLSLSLKAMPLFLTSRGPRSTQAECCWVWVIFLPNSSDHPNIGKPSFSPAGLVAKLPKRISGTASQVCWANLKNCAEVISAVL